MQVEMSGFSNIYGIRTDQFIEELADIGYQTMLYNVNNNQIEPAGEHWRHGEQNVLAVANDKIDFVNQRLHS